MGSTAAESALRAQRFTTRVAACTGEWKATRRSPVAWAALDGAVHAAPSAASATASAKFRFVIVFLHVIHIHPLYARKKAVPEGAAAFSHEKSLPSCPSQDAVARTKGAPAYEIR